MIKRDFFYRLNVYLCKRLSVLCTQKMRVVPKLPQEDQRYLVRTIEILDQKHGITE